ncbi:MAG: DNA methylase [Chloroflexi bacterium]|nr:DNA methylase [Chloroflexota bacterium]
MAVSPAHRFGQIIGDMLEGAILPLLLQHAKKNKLYLDRKGKRPCRPGLKCTWVDKNGNKHGLDFVLERGGTPSKQGTPVAFIETAWRRYTKHSRAKAQEIQGAIEPLAETYSHSGPFKGAVLAGVFTEGALSQLRSLGFTVVYFPYSSVIDAFKQVGIDAFSDEGTPDAIFQQKVNQWDALPASKKKAVAAALLKSNVSDVNKFMASLTAAVSRKIQAIIVLPLHGNAYEAKSVDEAVALLEDYDEARTPSSFERYEIHIRFKNGNEIVGKFNDKPSAIEFLRTYQTA